MRVVVALVLASALAGCSARATTPCADLKSLSPGDATITKAQAVPARGLTLRSGDLPVMALEGEGGNPALSSDVQAVVAMAGAYNLRWKHGVGPELIRAATGFVGAPLEAHTETMTAASPVTYVNSRSAPLLLLHSRTDR